MRHFVCALVIVLASTVTACAQEGRGLEISPGYVHISGNQGLDGLNAGAAYWFTNRIAAAFDYDLGWDTSRLGEFELSSVGLTTVKSRVQDFLIGPRIGVPGLLHKESLNGHALLPFLEVQMGASHLSSTVTQVNVGSVHASDHGFTWMVGGGSDIKLSPSARWFARMKIDLLRTHFVASGQSRVRIGFGIAHTFNSRP